ncbi:MAG: hypothetical protein GY714_31265 [Desulfobacterales bacterium]|nr:hypothetical protein [Desulfobacterales bacterium]MCP4159400.1 hypothetical protein [Deltaproteobacteria bacterium]
MILSSKEILKRVSDTGLVSGLSERELTNPEGPGFDLRVGEIFTIDGNGYLGNNSRKTPESSKVEDIVNNLITIKPGDYYLIKTIEEVKMDKDTFAMVYPRSTLFRSGLQLLSGKISPGYYGNLTFGLANIGPCEFTLEIGARVAFIAFFEVKDGEDNLSRGQWRGGRVSADKLEKQV